MFSLGSDGIVPKDRSFGEPEPRNVVDMGERQIMGMSNSTNFTINDWR